MAAAPRAVFVVDRDGEAMVYPTVRAAADHLEAVDVEADEYVAFDSGGQVLSLRAVGEDVEIVPTGRYDLEDARRRVRFHYARVGVGSDPDDLTVVANDLLRRDWEARWPKRPRWLAVRLHGAAPPQVPTTDDP